MCFWHGKIKNMRLTERQKTIFGLVVENYIRAGEPISSEWVARNLSEKVSSATVRNELFELERVGLLKQPHTSAGRVPTEEGYRAYIETFMQSVQVGKEMEVFEHDIANSTQTPEARVRSIARELSDLAGNVVIMGVDPRNMYSVGMGQMYSSPESNNIDVMRQISHALDHADDLMDNLFEAAAAGNVQILIGKENPIDENLALMVTTYASSEGTRIMALLGFMRMRYDRNIALMQAMKRLLESEN
jgi:transcriptional regulator of heat shock response